MLNCLLGASPSELVFNLVLVVNIRRQQEEELKQLEEETAKRLEEAIRKKVEEKMGSEEVKVEIERRIEEGRKKAFDDVEVQLKNEKEAALTEARRKEVSVYMIHNFSFSFELLNNKRKNKKN